MKRIILITASCAALAACNIADIDREVPFVFVKGQKVTLNYNTGNQTKVSSALVTTGVDKVKFRWGSGDKILVKVGEASAGFTLKSGAGSTFTHIPQVNFKPSITINFTDYSESKSYTYTPADNISWERGSTYTYKINYSTSLSMTGGISGMSSTDVVSW